MPNSLIPALDPAPLPGPPWLFQVLWVVTFLIHILMVNTVLGGTILAALAGLAGAGRRETQRLVVEVNSWTIALAITFAIAPLLFIQVVLGRFFYSATILVAWVWLGMLGVLTVGYYLNYLAKARLRNGRSAGALLFVEAACFLAIAAVQVTVNLLHMQPDRWQGVAGHAWAALSDPAFVPRFLHFVLAAAAMAGALIAFVAVRRAGKGGDREALSSMARYGVRAALIATLLQLVDGFWLLLALPEEVLRAFMRAGPATMVPLTVGILGGVLLLVVLAQIGDPLATPTKVRRVAELIVGTVVFMVVTRHQLRAIYLVPSRAGEQVQVATQWGPLALFLAVFVLCVALAVWALVKAVKDRPGPGEEAA
jgi:cytochrome bd-type quinol oxidase subunit 1